MGNDILNIPIEGKWTNVCKECQGRAYGKSSIVQHMWSCEHYRKPEMALSVRQPWAWLLVNGIKDVENRSWRTNFRGNLYIHASMNLDMAAFKRISLWAKPEIMVKMIENEIINDDMLVRGALIGAVDLTDVKYRSADENESLYSPWSEPGQYQFVMKNPVAFEKPVPCKGSLKIFDPFKL
jgi:hypothetical protein